MKSIEITGKSVDAAVYSGLQQLGVSIDEVRIETLQTETKGILGIGAKPAKVRLTVKPPEEVTLPDFDAERRNYHNERGAGSRDKRGERGNFKRSVKRREGYEGERDGGYGFPGDAPASKPEALRTGTAGYEADLKKANAQSGFPEDSPKTVKTRGNAFPPGRRPDSADRNKTQHGGDEAKRSGESGIRIEPLQQEPNAGYTEEAAADNPAANFVKGLLSRMGIRAKVLVRIEDDATRLKIESESMGVLIGHRGETLNSIQYLASLAVNRNCREEGYTRITVNTRDYREKRQETLKRLAVKVSNQVKASGRPRAFEPMNPYERRILHSALQSDPFVTTHSEGEEPNRRVIVTPRHG